MSEAIAVLATAQRAVTVPFDPPMMRDLVIVRQPGSPTPAAAAFLAVTGVWDRADYEQLTRRVCDASGYGAGSAAARGVASGSEPCSTRCWRTWTPTETSRSPPVSSLPP